MQNKDQRIQKQKVKLKELEQEKKNKFQIIWILISLLSMELWIENDL